MTAPVEVRRQHGGSTVHLLTEVFSGSQLIHARVACLEVGLWRRVEPAALLTSAATVRRCQRCAAAVDRARRQTVLPGIENYCRMPCGCPLDSGCTGYHTDGTAGGAP